MKVSKRVQAVLDESTYQREFDSPARQDIVRRFEDGSESEYIGVTPTFDEQYPEVDEVQRVLAEATESFTPLEKLAYEAVVIGEKSRNSVARAYGMNVNSITSAVDRAQSKLMLYIAKYPILRRFHSEKFRGGGKWNGFLYFAARDQKLPKANLSRRRKLPIPTDVHE